MVALLYLAGLLAAAQLGKLSALAPLIASALGLGLPTMALAISLIELGGAALGIAAGALAHRLGLRRTLRAGMAALALGGLGGAAAQGTAGLFGWRVLEAAGYLAVIVTAPVLIARHAGAAGPRTQGLALTLWSTFVPAGLALGAAASAGLAAGWGWRTAVAASALACAVLGLALWRARLPDAEPAAAGTAHEPLPPAVRWLVAGFGLFALFQIGVLALLPTLLVQQAGLGTAAAGRWTALAALSAVLGSAAGAWLLGRQRGLRWPQAWGLGLPPLLLFGLFTDRPDPPLALALAVGINVLGGVYASLSFALLPRLVQGAGPLVRANGWLAQCGASGSLLGPPLMASCVQAGGWGAAAGAGLVISAAAVACAWRATPR